jgi:hypothetical protein
MIFASFNPGDIDGLVEILIPVMLGTYALLALIFIRTIIGWVWQWKSRREGRD